MNPVDYWKNLEQNSIKNWGSEAFLKIDSVLFRKVGHNSSHEFYVGKLGNFWLVYSIDCEYQDDKSLKVFYSFEGMIDTAYLGHL